MSCLFIRILLFATSNPSISPWRQPVLSFAHLCVATYLNFFPRLATSDFHSHLYVDCDIFCGKSFWFNIFSIHTFIRVATSPNHFHVVFIFFSFASQYELRHRNSRRFQRQSTFPFTPLCELRRTLLLTFVICIFCLQQSRTAQKKHLNSVSS